MRLESRQSKHLTQTKCLDGSAAPKAVIMTGKCVELRSFVVLPILSCHNEPIPFLLYTDNIVSRTASQTHLAPDFQ